MSGPRISMALMPRIIPQLLLGIAAALWLSGCSPAPRRPASAPRQQKVQELVWLDRDTALAAVAMTWATEAIQINGRTEKGPVPKRSELWLIDANGRSAHKIPISRGMAEQINGCHNEGRVVFTFTPTPSGESSFAEGASLPWGRDIAWCDRQGGWQQLGLAGINSSPRWSPQGDRFAFGRIPLLPESVPNTSKQTPATPDRVKEGIWISGLDAAHSAKSDQSGWVHFQDGIRRSGILVSGWQHARLCSSPIPR